MKWKVVAGLVGGLLGASVLAGGISSAHPRQNSAKGITVSTATSSKYGTFLVSGHTVYALTPSSVACDAKCLKIWPQLLLPIGVKKPTTGKGINAVNLGTVKLKNGRLQVTYAGQPMYFFANDKAAGQVKGNLTDTWGKWAIVVLAPPSSSTTTTTMASGGGIGF